MAAGGASRNKPVTRASGIQSDPIHESEASRRSYLDRAGPQCAKGKRSMGKRNLGIEGTNEEDRISKHEETEPRRKKPRIQKSLHEEETAPCLLRSSPRLRKSRDSKKDLHGPGARLNTSARDPDRDRTRGVERPPRSTRQQENLAKHREVEEARTREPLEAKNEGHHRKNGRTEERRERGRGVSGGVPDHRNRVERWLDDSYGYDDWEATETMPPKRSAVASTLEDSLERSRSLSRRKSERSASTVHDPSYRQLLRRWNIHINHEDPSAELMRRARKITCGSRISPELDDEATRQLMGTSRRVEEQGEEAIVQKLATGIIPAMMLIPDQRLDSNANQPWSNRVAIPAKAGVLANPLPLPKPKPDLAFGYSARAFSDDQLETIELLVEGQSGGSYAIPDQALHFPFLVVEFKSQAKNGTHFVGTSQAANAGAVALNGILDLTKRNSGMEEFDYDEPRFFSLTMDHELVRINVHWIQAPIVNERKDSSFHVECLSKHLLDDASGIRAVVRAVKNILDQGANVQLETIRTALDKYRERVVRDREALDAQRTTREAMQRQSEDGIAPISDRTNTEP